jgi:hypothetical protein
VDGYDLVELGSCIFSDKVSCPLSENEDVVLGFEECGDVFVLADVVWLDHML